MLTNETTRKLQEMHLGVMARAFTTQLADNQVSALSFEDRFALLVDAEWAVRKSNHLKRLIKKADFADPGACIEDIEYGRARWSSPLTIPATSQRMSRRRTCRCGGWMSWEGSFGSIRWLPRPEHRSSSARSGW